MDDEKLEVVNNIEDMNDEAKEMLSSNKGDDKDE